MLELKRRMEVFSDRLKVVCFSLKSGQIILEEASQIFEGQAESLERYMSEPHSDSRSITNHELCKNELLRLADCHAYYETSVARREKGTMPKPKPEGALKRMLDAAKEIQRTASSGKADE
jgi:hypothetical protein